MNYWSAMGVAGENHKHEFAPVVIRPGVLLFPDAAALAHGAATRFVHLAEKFISGAGVFHVALSGGRTPQQMYRLLAGDPFRGQVEWAKVHVFWSDERAVPPDHPDSNYGMAWRELLSHVPIPGQNVHRMEAEIVDIEAARKYEEILKKILPADARGFPRFDLILLGMGSDAHTASLFPDAGISTETRRWVVTPFVKQLGARRMTLTLPVLNAARYVVFLVSGQEKAEALRNVLDQRNVLSESLRGASAQPPLPAQLVQPTDGERLFLVDAPAAKLLTSPRSREQ